MMSTLWAQSLVFSVGSANRAREEYNETSVGMICVQSAVGR